MQATVACPVRSGHATVLPAAGFTALASHVAAHNVCATSLLISCSTRGRGGSSRRRNNPAPVRSHSLPVQLPAAHRQSKSASSVSRRSPFVSVVFEFASNEIDWTRSAGARALHFVSDDEGCVTGFATRGGFNTGRGAGPIEVWPAFRHSVRTRCMHGTRKLRVGELPNATLLTAV
jgi:hypothetical protein